MQMDADLSTVYSSLVILSISSVGSSGSDPEQSLLMEMVLNKAEALFDKPRVGTRWPTGTLPGRGMSSLSVRPVSY